MKVFIIKFCFKLYEIRCMFTINYLDYLYLSYTIFSYFYNIELNDSKTSYIQPCF